MAFVVATKRGTFEIRESRSTPKGPRSTTLASFRELSDEVIEKARTRAAEPPSVEQLRAAAVRAGAPGAHTPVDRAARDLIAEVGKGNELDPALRNLLLGLLEKERGAGEEPVPISDSARSAAAWIGSSPAERGRALVDLLLLADALPERWQQRGELSFPRLDSRPRG